MQTIVVIGGGFAGLNFVKHLDENKYRVKLVDKNNFTAFPPLFYQVASSGLTASNIAFVRVMLSHLATMIRGVWLLSARMRL